MKHLKLAIIVAALFALPSAALAADPAVKPAKPSLLSGYVAGQCGMYFGVNSMGSAGTISGGPPGASIIQGDVGLTLGYGCPFGQLPGNFWFVEGNFDWAGLNGSQNGLALTGPLHFEQRAGVGSPLSSMLNMFPSLTNGLSVPALPVLPAGVSAGPSYPFIFVSLHEQDISASFGLAQNREWLISPGIGIGLESRLSNSVVADTTCQWVMQSSGLTVGPNSVKLGNAVECGLTLKY
jgi:hypothetical protein